MAVLERHPSLTQEQAREKAAAEYASAGYKEYSSAPWAVSVAASFPVEAWPAVWYSWLSYKGHSQSYHDLESILALVTRNQEGEVLAQFTLVFTTEDALESFLETGYTPAAMLSELDIPDEDVNMQVFREVS